MKEISTEEEILEKIKYIKKDFEELDGALKLIHQLHKKYDVNPFYIGNAKIEITKKFGNTLSGLRDRLAILRGE